MHRDCHLPAPIGVPRVSHPLHALTAPHAFRACFIPVTPVGFGPTGLCLFAGSNTSRRPRPSWRLPGGIRAQPLAACVRVRALNHAVTDALQHRKPGACWRRPGCTTRCQAACGRSRWLLAEPFPRVPPAFITARARGDCRRTAPGSPSGPISLQRTGVLGRGFRPDSRPVCPHGLRPLQGSLATRRGTAFASRPSPLGLRASTAQRSGSLSHVAP